MRRLCLVSLLAAFLFAPPAFAIGDAGNYSAHIGDAILNAFLQIAFGIIAAVAGVALLFTSYKRFRARSPYINLALFGLWAVVWGADHLYQVNESSPTARLLPGWIPWALFLAGLLAMMRDGVGRYHEEPENPLPESEAPSAAGTDRLGENDF